jgi:hypothetical protein
MKYLFVLPLILLSIFCQGQEKINSIGINYGIGGGSIGNSHSRNAVGGVGNDGKSVAIIGISYWHGFNQKIQLETGVQYLKHNYTIHYPFFPQNTKSPTDHALKLISVPIKVKYDIWKYIFFSGGLYVDIDISKSARYAYIGNFSGIGAGAGIGFQYPFSNGLGLYVNPQVDLRNVISFSRDNNQKALRAEFVTLGLNYRFK